MRAVVAEVEIDLLGTMEEIKHRKYIHKKL